MSNLENFNFIFEQIEKNNATVRNALGKHVHWGYWPMPATSDLSFDEAAGNLVDTLCQFANICDEQNILDVGCGFGGTIDHLNQRHSHIKLTGINIDPRQLKVAQKNVQVQNQNHISFIHDDACKMQHIRGHYDHILVVESIFYFSSRVAFFEKALNHLKPGGAITLSDFVMSPFLIPSCQLLSFFDFKNLHPFGSLHFITLKKYYDLCQKFNLHVEVYDINYNTLPTYNLLYQLMAEFGFNKLKTFLWRRGLSILKILSHLDLNRYLMLKFTRAY